jgi:hypothetical protein
MLTQSITFNGKSVFNDLVHINKLTRHIYMATTYRDNDKNYLIALSSVISSRRGESDSVLERSASASGQLRLKRKWGGSLSNNGVMN